MRCCEPIAAAASSDINQSPIRILGKNVTEMGEHLTCDKRGKSCNCCHAQENMKPALSAGKHSTGINMRGKTWKSCQGRENMSLASSAGKHATGVMRGKFARKLIRIDVDVAFD